MSNPLYPKIEYTLNKIITPKYDFLCGISIQVYSELNPQPYLLFNLTKGKYSQSAAEIMMDEVINMVRNFFGVYMKAYYNNSGDC